MYDLPMNIALSRGRQENISEMIRYVVKNNIPGDILDIGVYEGGSSCIMLYELLANGINDRRVFLYDTFEGMPEPTAEDGDNIKARYDYFGPGNWVNGPLELVKRYISQTNYPSDYITYVKGLVEDTLPGNQHTQIAYMRLDTDFYSSTKVELEELYHKVVPGGVIIIDDYWSKFIGQTKAVNDFFKQNNLDLSILKRAGDVYPDNCTAYFIKK